MRLLILALFLAVPLTEIAVFIQVGGAIGPASTVAAVVATAALGLILLRTQGLATLRRAQASVERGEAPVREVFDGVCLLIAGILLLIPGFLTDAVGFLLFLPPVRAGLRRALGGVLVDGRVRMQGFPQPPPHPHQNPRAPDSGGAMDIEGEYRDVTPDNDNGKGPRDDGRPDDNGPGQPPRLGPQ